MFLFCFYYERDFREACLMDVLDLLSGYVKHSADTLYTLQPAGANGKQQQQYIIILEFFHRSYCPQNRSRETSDLLSSHFSP